MDNTLNVSRSVTRSVTSTVGILGGMGPAAGADFARLFVQACADNLRSRGAAVTDQAFPEHWLAQVPIPDRTAASHAPTTGGHQPLEPMLQAVAKLSALGATTIAVACNTAHIWHAELQHRFPQLEVLHVAREVAQTLAGRGVREVGLLATQATYSSKLYDEAFAQHGVKCFVPTASEREQLMHGIFKGVKSGNLPLANTAFVAVAEALAKRHGLQTLVLGCTEIPLVLTSLPGMGNVNLIDPARLLAQALAERAYRLTPSPVAI